MPVPVVQVGIMGMAVHQRGMLVVVGMRFAAVPGEIVLVPVVLVVHVPVSVGHRLVRVHMGVPFGEMQPEPKRHQQRRHPEPRTRHFVQQHQRRNRTDEWSQ